MHRQDAYNNAWVSTAKILLSQLRGSSGRMRPCSAPMHGSIAMARWVASCCAAGVLGVPAPLAQEQEAEVGVLVNSSGSFKGYAS